MTPGDIGDVRFRGGPCVGSLVNLLRPRSQSAAAVSFCFEAKAWQDLRFSVVQLTHVFRQTDPAFVALLNEVRHAALTPETVQRLEGCARPRPVGRIVPTKLRALNREVLRPLPSLPLSVPPTRSRFLCPPRPTVRRIERASTAGRARLTQRGARDSPSRGGTDTGGSARRGATAMQEARHPGNGMRGAGHQERQ